MSWAFSDESERADRVLFGLTLVPAGVVKDARRTLRGLLLPGQRRLHMSKESPRRRREILAVLTDIEMSTMILELRRPPGTSRVDARSRLLVAGAEIVAAGLAGEVGEVLERPAGHDVGRKVVVDGPVGIEAEGLDEAGEVHVLVVDLRVRDARAAGFVGFEAIPIAVVLVVEVDADLHGALRGQGWGRGHPSTVRRVVLRGASGRREVGWRKKGR